MIAIIWDTETTGLVKPNQVPINKQPEIIEYAGIKYDFDKGEEVDRLEFLCKPKKPVTPEITKITGLTNDDLKGEKPFAAYYKDLCKFYLGVEYSIAHNHQFDNRMMELDLTRIGKQFSFPWTSNQICTVERTRHFKNRRIKLNELHVMATDKDIQQAHRAMNDVEALLRVCIWLNGKGEL